jgi:hypothetical protein
MKKNLVVFFLSVILITGCSLFEKQSFSGPWEMTLKGGYSDTLSFVVDAQRSFSFTKDLIVGSNQYEATFRGKIAEDGTMTCDVSVQGMNVASLKGTFNFENGSGTWSGSSYDGTWTAVKK